MNLIKKYNSTIIKGITNIQKEDSPVFRILTSLHILLWLSLLSYLIWTTSSLITEYTELKHDENELFHYMELVRNVDNSDPWLNSSYVKAKLNWFDSRRKTMWIYYSKNYSLILLIPIIIFLLSKYLNWIRFGFPEKVKASYTEESTIKVKVNLRAEEKKREKLDTYIAYVLLVLFILILIVSAYYSVFRI